MTRRLREHYGAGPLHLIALVASFAIAGAAVVGWFERPRDVTTVLIWFAAAAVLHDLMLLPLYSLLDWITVGAVTRRIERVRPGRAGTDRPINPTGYIRIPALLSVLLLVVFLPVILGQGTQSELSASGIAERGYLARWLLACGVMFAISGAAYAVATARVSRRGARANSTMPR
ncbi:MAG: hypothetical protein ACRDQH_09470 [Pseudonocardiaceae bacterium]